MPLTWKSWKGDAAVGPRQVRFETLPDADGGELKPAYNMVAAEPGRGVGVHLTRLLCAV